MKIKTTTGQVINTAKLSDKEAQVSEAINSLYEVCKLYNLTLLTKVIVSDNKFIGAQNQESGPKSNQSMEFLFNLINDYCISASNGNIRLVKMDNDKIDEDNPFD